MQVLASEMYASGVEALEDREFVEAADYLAQCLQFHAERSGDTSIEASVIGLKYAEALLGCARMKGTSVLGTMKVSFDTVWWCSIVEVLLEVSVLREVGRCMFPVLRCWSSWDQVEVNQGCNA